MVYLFFFKRIAFYEEQGIVAKHVFSDRLASGIRYCECGSCLPVSGRSCL